MAVERDPSLVLPPRERRRRNREQMIAAILDSARAVMRERGVAALSLREVARRVSMQAPSLYEYFPSKGALYDALFLTGFRLFQERIVRRLEEPASFWGRIEAIFAANVGFAREHPDLYQLVFERPVPGFTPSEATMAEGRVLLDRFTALIAEAIDGGEIRPGLSAAQTRDLFIAMIHGLTSQHLANDADAPPGGGRYGGLIGPALALFRASWTPQEGERS